MTNVSRKIDDSTLEFTKVIPKKTEKVLYDFKVLVRQKEMLETDLARVIEQHAAEIKLAEDRVAEVVNLLAEFKKLGIGEAKVKTKLQARSR